MEGKRAEAPSCLTHNSAGELARKCQSTCSAGRLGSCSLSSRREVPKSLAFIVHDLIVQAGTMMLDSTCI